MGKILGRIAAVAAVVFLGYMLITGQVSIAWEKVIIYIIFIGGFSIAAEIRARRQKKQDEKYFREHQSDAAGFDMADTLHATDMERTGAADSILHATDAGTPGQTPAQGVVRTSTALKGLMIFLVVFIWLMLALITVLAAMDGAFADLENISTFGVILVVAALFTVGYLWLIDNFCREIYYTPQGVTVKGWGKKQYSWSEIGSYTQKNYYLYIFRDREGKRLFVTNCSYEGFDGFFAQYRRTHDSAA